MKIKATDLRVGNLVNDEDGTPMYIAGIWPTQVGDRFIDSAGNAGKITLLSPIELSSDILIKAGFLKLNIRPENDEDWIKTYALEHVSDKGGYNVFYERTDFLLAALRDDDTYWSLVYENAGYDEDAHIYTHKSGITNIHQLQNLYFALTGTELNITL